MHLKNTAGFLLKKALQALSHVFAWNGFIVSSRGGQTFDSFSARPAYVFCRIPRK
jgi:hypothetical protein